MAVRKIKRTHKMLNTYQTDDDIVDSSIDGNIFICSSTLNLKCTRQTNQLVSLIEFASNCNCIDNPYMV